ncbi:MAG: hypothetical protein VW270_24000 [Candidatus Poseidoniales archaeon]|jgi:hypothetical protein
MKQTKRIEGDYTITTINDTDVLTLDSKTIVANGNVDVSSGVLQLGTFTTTERNNLTVSEGAIIYNTTDDKVQVYINGAWTNIH